jgi:two-component system, OmpR family, phosphate regulon response regulator PhoB
LTQTILIADDHEEMRQLVVELLETQGYEIRQAADTQAVLEQIASHRPDLLILDVNMPGDGGLAALKSIRENQDLDRMRVLVLSGSVDLAPEWLSQLGADAHLPKPFPIDELHSTVRELLPADAAI